MSWKNNIYELMFKVTYPIRSIIGRQPKVLSITKTVNNILDGKSCIRFGDGEMKLIQMESIQFQHADKVLSGQLYSALQNDRKNLLVCIPDVYTSLAYMTPKDRKYWYFYLMGHLKRDLSLLSLNKTYGNAFISRPYMLYRNKKIAKYVFDNLPLVWNDKIVLIVEGEKTRFGCGNTLLNNAKQVRRILCPNFNAFDWYERIYQTVREIEKPDLIILALGPTATVLGSTLFQEGYRVLDLGHFDIEYEWYLKNVHEKTCVPNKIVTEALNGIDIGEYPSEDYLSSIVAVIGDKPNGKN